MVYNKESAGLNIIDVSKIIELKNIQEQLNLYVKENKRLANELRSLRHSTLNILHNINCYIEFEDWQGLSKYFNEILEKTKNVSNTSLSSIENVLNPSLKKLLYSKSDYIMSTDIDIKVMIDDNIQIENNTINETDLCKVINEFLDNAIQAASSASHKKISVYFINNERSLDIIIESTFKEKPNLSLINEGINTIGYRESAAQSASVILSNYPNVLNNAFIQHQVFVQELQIIK